MYALWFDDYTRSGHRTLWQFSSAYAARAFAETISVDQHPRLYRVA